MRETVNYWKKVAFGLALIAGLCGGAWAQDLYQLGYTKGLEYGRHDRLSNRPYQPTNYKLYKNTGDYHGAYREAFRSGFLAGYDRGFGSVQGHRGPGPQGGLVRYHDRDDDRWERRRDHDRWERREGYEYRTYGDHDRPPGWDRGEKTGWGDCGVPPGQAKRAGECRTYVHEGRPHYYYHDEQGRIVVRRPEAQAHGDADKDKHHHDADSDKHHHD